MPKAYDPKPESDELFLKLGNSGPSVVCVDLVDRAGGPHVTLLTIRDDGVRALPRVSSHYASRAGFSPNAIDANGRMKVIGQEVEAERMGIEGFDVEDTAERKTMTVRDAVSAWDGGIRFNIRDVNGLYGITISPADIRDLAARLNRHVAYLDKEGLE